jgi:hypothetical protein
VLIVARLQDVPREVSQETKSYYTTRGVGVVGDRVASWPALSIFQAIFKDWQGGARLLHFVFYFPVPLPICKKRNIVSSERERAIFSLRACSSLVHDHGFVVIFEFRVPA